LKLFKITVLPNSHFFTWIQVNSRKKFTLFHVNSREFKKKIHTFSREFTWIQEKDSYFFTKSFFLPVWTARQTKLNIASHELFHNKSFVLKTIHVTSSYRNPLQIATASEPRKFKLTHAVKPKFLGSDAVAICKGLRYRKNKRFFLKKLMRGYI
jgi:hypothetical protein